MKRFMVFSGIAEMSPYFIKYPSIVIMLKIECHTLH